MTDRAARLNAHTVMINKFQFTEYDYGSMKKLTGKMPIVLMKQQ